MKILKQKDFDLGKSKISDLFFTICIPTVIAVIITGTFVIFDGIFITHGFHEGTIFEGDWWNWTPSGDNPEAKYASYGAVALGYSVPYTLLIISAGIMVGGAISYNLSKARAKNDKVREQQILDSFLPTCIIVGIILMFVLIPFAKFWVWMGSGFQPIFIKNWLNNPLFNNQWTSAPDPLSTTLTDQIKFGPGAAGHIFQQSSWYLRIQALAAIPYIYMIAVPYILREEGKSSTFIYVNLLALGGNILWDFILIIVLGMNLVGAALATIIAETMGALSFRYYLRTRASTTVKESNWNVAKADFPNVFKNGSPYMGMQLLQMSIVLSMTMSIGFVFYNDPVTISYFNSSFQNYFSFYALINLITLGTMASATPLINYNYNIKNKERLNESKLLGRRVLITMCTIATLLVFFFPVIITTLFNSENNFLAQKISQIMILGFTMGTMILYSGLYFQGLGQSKKASTLIFAKPILIFTLAIIVGLTFKQFPEVHLIWKHSILPWNESWDEDVIIPLGVCLGIFWVVPFVDILLGTIGLILMNKSINQIELEFAHEDYIEKELEEEFEEIVKNKFTPIEKLNKKEIRKANKIEINQAKKDLKKWKNNNSFHWED